MAEQTKRIGQATRARERCETSMHASASGDGQTFARRARKGWTGGAGEPSAVPAARVRWSHPPQATGERIGAGRSSR